MVNENSWLTVNKIKTFAHFKLITGDFREFLLGNESAAAPPPPASQAFFAFISFGSALLVHYLIRGALFSYNWGSVGGWVNKAADHVNNECAILSIRTDLDE